MTSRRRVLLATLALPGCSGGTDPPAASSRASCAKKSAASASAGYCLVEPDLVRIAGGATIPVDHALLVRVDDHTAALLLRDAGGLFALSAICTHACCAVTLCRDAACSAVDPGADGCSITAPSALPPPPTPAFLCPCHGSAFASDGTVLNGPATEPLPALAVSRDGADAIVDTSLVVTATTRA